MPVYITDVAIFLPNAAVNNEQMEEILGKINQLPSRTRRMILRNNKIEQRYYAIDPETGATTHSNAQLTAEAIRRLRPYPDFASHQIECLSCGTSTPDQLMPGHASMVHGELGGAPLEAVSTIGVCLAGISALKYAWMSVAGGQSRNAVASGSELASTFMRAAQMKKIPAEKLDELEKDLSLTFEEDFLRWMLSDGAGAAYLQDQPATAGRSLRIDWIDIHSFANELDVCMYAGANKLADGSLKGWRDYDKEAAATEGVFNIKQDVKLLNAQIIDTSARRTIPRVIARHALRAEQVDWFLPHYSSNYFRQPLMDGLRAVGMDIPEERWFTNLATKGNTGAASFYIMLEELFKSGRLRQGDRILAYIPESGRFAISYLHLTVI
ncbi:MAG TPA: beta-ketoacyl-ACP synthase III [Pelovirga sp.]|nr:beta-ketoacyl-ACP synthase III [Pelovirga sp.]